MTKCPLDFSEMEKKAVDVIDQVVLDVCPKCDGIWMDREKLKRLSKDTMIELRLRDRGGGRHECPSCSNRMNMSEYIGVRLDDCVKFDECQCGIYFDKGKIEKIIGKPLILKSKEGMPSVGVNVSQLEELVDKRIIIVDAHELRLISDKKDAAEEETPPAGEAKTQKEKLGTRIHNFFEKPRGKFAIGTEIFILYLIIMSVILTVLELFFADAVRQYAWIIDPVNMGILIVFTVEYVLRIATAPRIIYYATRPLNIVDLMAILPSIIEEILHMTVEYETMAFRGLRLLRFLRFARLLRALRLMRITYKLMWME